MVYDNTKLEAAVGKWLEVKCKVGYGMEYSGALQKSFEDFLAETAMLQCSPGVIAFGREMNRRGFGRKRFCGLQHITGLALLEQPGYVEERRMDRGRNALIHAEEERQEREKQVKKKIKKEVGDTKEDRAVKRRMAKETKERIANVGLVDEV